jgi:hypothetical protein
MALESIHLRKLLKLIFLEPNQRRTALRAEIREDLRREAGEEAGGGDFYTPFWADAKSHVFGGTDLRRATDSRIMANPRRQNLYPQLRDGFLQWWDQKRRWTNTPFKPGKNYKARFRFPGLDATVKVESLLSVIDGVGEEYVVYSYFAQEPKLTEESARLALWLLMQALPAIPPSQLRILDIIRGNTFSIDRNPLAGDEEIEFRARYARLIRERDELRADYL